MYQVLTFIFILCSGSVFSQTFLATYDAVVKTTTGPSVSGENSLYFTVDTAIYIHDDYPTESSYSTADNVVTFVLGDPDGMPILTLRREKKQRYKEEYSASEKMFIFEEHVPEIEWKIEGDQVESDGLILHKATGVYGERNYEVWFSPDVPFPYGPHRLGGLPGLIIRAHSDDGMVGFELTGFGELSENDRPANLFDVGEGVPISNGDFKQFIIKKLLRVEAMTTSEVTFTNEDPNENYSIEKNRWKIISEYKSQRNY